MFVQISTDNQHQDDAEANARLEEQVRAKLQAVRAAPYRRRGPRLRHERAKGGDGDKRVSLEARPTGHQPIAVHAEARRVDTAVTAPRKRRCGRSTMRSARARDHDAEDALRSKPDLAKGHGAMIRVASYNMRKAIGTDRRRRPERTIEVLNELDADVDRAAGGRPALRLEGERDPARDAGCAQRL